jgi:GT2 family glycosyltransferase
LQETNAKSTEGATPIVTANRPARPTGPPLSDARRSYVDDQYPTLVRNNRIRANDLIRLQDETSNFRYRPLISILLPVFDAEREWLERGLDSVISQVYPEWELHVCGDSSTPKRAREAIDLYECLDERIKVTYLEQSTNTSGLLNAGLSLTRGEFVGLLSYDDELAVDALSEVVKLLQEHPEAGLIYSDEDKIDEDGNRSGPYFKPGWSPDLILSTNYVSRLSVYRRSLLEEIGGLREGFDECSDYDLVLRATERTGRIYHVPKVLYHRRADARLPLSPDNNESRARDGARRAISEALKRRELEGSVEDGLLPGRFRTRLKIGSEPKVSVIIPTRDNVSVLRNCVESIERSTTYRNYELLIVDNDSRDPATVEYLASTPHRVIPFREAFNYSRINNFGVSQAEGEYVLLLNDDTEVISGEWMEAMLEHAQRPEVGAVGARLLYPDGRIQHAGVVVGVGDPWAPGIAMSSHQFYSSDSPGYAGTAATTTNYSAVTAACMLVRKSLFNELGGLDEENLRVQFNDVDLCLRMREKGYSIVYTPYAELYHHESVSRGHWSVDLTENLYMRERWGEVLDNDPYYNANFSRGSADFNLRADLLRPKVLRSQQIEQAHENFISFLKSLWQRWRHTGARYVYIRSSPRTAILPKSANDAVSISHSKGARPHQDQPLKRKLTDYWARKLSLLRPLRVEQLIWMFGSPRTGSTWLSKIMAELENQERWHEPYVGLLFGSFIYERLKDNDQLLNSPAFIMGEPYREVWLNSIKSFVLEGAKARYPALKKDQYLVVKEPNGSIGAPLLLGATPESRLIFLIRDSRDVVASRLDALGEGSWGRQDRDYSTTEKLNEFTKHLAEDYLRVVSQVQKAYEAHASRKALVRYEDLRYEPTKTLKTMYGTLGIEVDETQLEAAVAKHSWTQIPDSEKGSGKFYRRAQPGSWKNDLSSEQIKIIENITGPILSRYY